MVGFRNTLWALTLFCVTAYSQTEKEIVASYRKALGNAIDDSFIKTMHLSGDFQVQKLNLPASVFFKAPGFMRVEMAFQNLKFIQVTTDSVIWEYNPIEDSHKVSPVDKSSSGRKANNAFDYTSEDLLSYKELKYGLKLIKKAKLDSLEVYILELTKEKGVKKTFYIDTQTNLIYKIKDEEGNRYFANYVNESGLIFPKFVIDSTRKQYMQCTFRQLDINKPVGDSMFEIPKEAYNQKPKKNALQELVNKGDHFFRSANYDSAAYYYSAALKMDSDNFSLYNSRGLARINAGSYYEAVGDLNRAIEIDPQAAVAFNNRGLAKFYLKDHENAVKDYTKAIELDAKLLVAYKNRGLSFLQTEQNENALKDFDQAIKLSPADSEAHFKRGVTLAQLENYNEAVDAYREAGKLKFNTAEFFNYKGVSEFQLESFDSALVSFGDAVERDPENLQYIENYGRTLYELGNYTEAAAQYEKYLKLESDAPEIYNLLGLCKYQEENYKGAIQDFTAAIKLHENATYFDNRASAKENLEDYDGAIKDYSESIRVYPNDASVFYKRGMLKIHLAKKIEGCQDLSTAHDMEYEPAKEAILKNCN